MARIEADWLTSGATQRVFALLDDAGCDEAQGYYYSKPFDPNELGAFVRERGVVGK